MLTFIVTVILACAAAYAAIEYAPAGWRTRIIMWGSSALGILAGLLQQLAGIDWSKLIDSPKVSYGLMVAIPLIGAYLREITNKPPGDK